MTYRLRIDVYFDISLMPCQESSYSHAKKPPRSYDMIRNSTSEPYDVKFTPPKSSYCFYTVQTKQKKPKLLISKPLVRKQSFLPI